MAKYKQKKSKSRAEEAEMEKAYQSMTGPKKKHGNISAIAICIAAVIVLIAVLIGLYFLMQTPSQIARVPSNVTAAGVSIGGMTQDEAEEALLQATQDTYTSKSMVIRVLDTTLELTPVDTGAAFNASEAAKAAVRLTAADPQIMDILPYLTLDTTAIENAVSKLGRQYNSEFSESGYAVEGDRPADPEQFTGQTLVLTVGTPGYGLDTDKLYNRILTAYNNNIFEVDADCSAQEPKQLDLDAIYQELCNDPVDAVMDLQTREITPEVYGYQFDLEDAKQALAESQPGDVLRISIEQIVPEVTEETLKNTMFRDTLASFSSPHTVNENRNTNLRLACEAVNGLVLEPGEVFSFNETLGERTVEKGYKPGATYVGANTVDTIGGGICQVASTIYYCALMADLEIVARECHMYTPDYVPWGMDATINWGTIDFQFRNNTEYPLRIDADVSGGYVNIALVGTDTKTYYVKMEYEIADTYEPKTIYKEMDADNPEGYEDGDVITYPYTGYCVYSYRCKYDKETDSMISRTYEAVSYYNSRDKVVCKIIGAEPTEETQPDIITGGGVTEDGGN